MAGDSEHAAARERLLREIEIDFRSTAQRTGRGAPSPMVLEAMRRVPRHLFVPDRDRDAAYGNYPLSIGHGQTISQPFIVALMTDLLALPACARVLEIGTGCGYQTAVLAEVAAEVYSIEYIPALAQSAKQRLSSLGYRNIRLRVGDGRLGWPEAAPFDGILVTAAASEIPPALTRQLKVGGRTVIPVGARLGGQQLLLVRRDENGQVSAVPMLPVAFVPLVGGVPEGED